MIIKYNTTLNFLTSKYIYSQGNLIHNTHFISQMQGADLRKHGIQNPCSKSNLPLPWFPHVRRMRRAKDPFATFFAEVFCYAGIFGTDHKHVQLSACPGEITTTVKSYDLFQAPNGKEPEKCINEAWLHWSIDFINSNVKNTTHFLL